MVSPATKCEAYVALAAMSYHRTGPRGSHGSPQNRCCRDTVGTTSPPQRRASHSSARIGHTSWGVKPMSSVTPRARP